MHAEPCPATSFERAIIRERINAGIGRAQAALAKNGYVARCRGICRSLGRPEAEAEKLAKAKELLARGVGILKMAKTVGSAPVRYRSSKTRPNRSSACCPEVCGSRGVVMSASDLWPVPSLIPSLILFAIAGLIFYRFRYYMVWDRELREFVLPKDMPRHVWIWVGVAIALILGGVIISPRPL